MPHRRERELAEASIADVVGVVDASGAAGVKSRGDQLWTLTFEFAAWRVDRGPVRTDALRLRRAVTDSELDAYRNTIEPYAVLHARARLVEGSAGEGAQALLVEIVGPAASDAELNAYAQQLQHPVTFNDTVCGTFTLDRTVNWFTSESVWNGRAVKLSLSLDAAAGEPAGALKTAHGLFRDQAEWDRRIRTFAVADLLPVKNESWLETDESELSEDQFLRLMTIEAITTYPDGKFEFWYQDGDLFWGHAIKVNGNLVQGPTAADIAG